MVGRWVGVVIKSASAEFSTAPVLAQVPIVQLRVELGKAKCVPLILQACAVYAECMLHA